MTNIIVPMGLRKGMNKGAFRGDLICPACYSRAIRFIENVGPYRLRYRCRKCGVPFQYETGHDLMGGLGTHPYAPFKQSKFQRIVESFGQGRKKEN